MTYAPEPYFTRGWTAQHQHRTTAEPPHLELGEPGQEPAEDKPGKTERKTRKR